MEKGEEAEVVEKSGEAVVCDACGTKNTEEDDVCRNCGEALWEETEEGEGAPEGWKPLLIGGALAAVVLVLFLWKPWAAKKTEGEGTGGASAPAAGPFNEIHDIEQQGDQVWVGTSGGVFAYDRKTLETKYEKTDGLLHPFIDSLLVDKKGVKWLGTFGGGINSFDGTNWNAQEPGVTKGATIINSYEDSKGRIWFCSDAAGVFVFDGQGFTQYTTKEGLPSDQVHVVAEDKDGSMWMGTTDGLAHFKDGKWKTYRTSDGLTFNHVLVIVVDGKGEKWFGTWGGGMSRFDGKTWTTIKPVDGLTSDYVLSADTDSEGRIWLGTYDGVSVWDGKGWTQYRESDGLLGKDVWATKVDSDGYKWFGTYKGVSRLSPDNKEWKTIVR